MTFPQQQNHLTTHFLESIPFVKRHMTVHSLTVSQCDSSNEYVYTNNIFLPAYITNFAHSRMKLETTVFVLLSLSLVTDIQYNLSWNYMITT